MLAQLQPYVRVIISTGGGSVVRDENWAHLQSGLVVFLDVPPEVLATRLTENDGSVSARPLLKESLGGDPTDKLCVMLESRRPKYEQADVHVSFDGSEALDECVSKVCEAIETYMDSNPPRWQQWQDRARSQGLDHV